ncbi:uncharacterized protein A1O9_02001 [Exophiala aquamarina CBS 119918]|uniref:Histidine kinase n=1 Tax=Exophiala aquamarina CBS 119918 TaxID=1182545 RepID=A0A072PXW6_9EURO|nr:uncharacterized protein A1O9_02001 [Exophiala aquamarina CBS 119918]KEF60440.1 hypothetical protein A1O9_02001 [Exophiala aquamarina CBS 119918]
MPPQGARDRELHRHYQPWLDTFISTIEATAINPPPGHSDSHKPRSSRDKSLTAFAQLGCLRLNAKRGVVTLIDSEKQYIVAEATKSLSLLNDAQHNPGDGLYFGNAFVARSQGISQDALFPETCTVSGPDGSCFSAPALIINDIAEHPIYKTRGYAGTGVNFYCGVPLKTRLGHVIGVYNVTDDKPRTGLSPDELHFMVDMATIVVDHLEVVKNNRARARGERLIHGIGKFIEGRTTHADENPEETPHHAPNSDVPVSKNQQIETPQRKILQSWVSEEVVPSFKGMRVGDANVPHSDHKRSPPECFNPRPQHRRGSSHSALPTRRASLPSSKVAYSEHQQNVASKKSQPNAKEKAIHDYYRVFDRAATILRYCLAAEGVAFLDASSANLSSGSTALIDTNSHPTARHSRGRPRPNLHHAGDGTHQQKTHEVETTPEPTSHESSDSASASIDPHQNDRSTASSNRSKKCQVLGKSGKMGAIEMSERLFRRCVRRHPGGRCFSFDKSGNLASSDESSESATGTVTSDAAAGSNTSTQVPSLARSRPNALLKSFPGARNIVLLPLWDFAKERWHSGLVIWSNDPAKLVNVDDDMAYLKAFSNAVMNEVNRINLALSDTAKATFLASISHELRSPLHGILGSIEFLHDTPMDDFQASMLISAETCGKTLLDTVNHVLDYAKINNLAKHNSRHLGHPRNQGNPQASSSDSSLTSCFNLASVVEEVVEAIYAGQVFRSVQADVIEGRGSSHSSSERIVRDRSRLNDNDPQVSMGNQHPVKVTLQIENHTNWNVKSQPGAVRRVVTNILGNALKYTNSGSINVSLKPGNSLEKDASHLHVLLSVADTGMGMSGEYVKNHAFTAFSQENALSSGTGLGLSIVRQIVDSLGGQIHLSSEKNVGTDLEISLSLPRAGNAQLDDPSGQTLAQLRVKTKGLKLCILEPPLKETNALNDPVRGISKMPTVPDSVKQMLATWFEMNIATAPSMQGASPNFFMYLEPPPIEWLIECHGNPDSDAEVPVLIVCTNAFEAASLRSKGIHLLTDIGRIIEVIPQPLGPQKMASALLRCMQRLKLLKDPDVRHSTAHVPMTASQQNIDHTSAEATQGSRISQGQPAENLERRNQIARQLIGQPRAQERAFPDFDQRLETTLEVGSVPDAVTKDGENYLPHVLVVDDNHINLILLVAFVRRTKHPFESAVDGSEALTAYKRSAIENEGASRFKYILMDISMPVMDGIASTKAIRQFERDKRIESPATIIALTGLGDQNAQQDAFHAGFDQFLSKPIVSPFVFVKRAQMLTYD